MPATASFATSEDAAHLTVTGTALAGDSVTVKIREPPSCAETSATLSFGRSLVLTAVEASDQSLGVSPFSARTRTW